MASEHSEDKEGDDSRQASEEMDAEDMLQSEHVEEETQNEQPGPAAGQARKARGRPPLTDKQREERAAAKAKEAPPKRSAAKRGKAQAQAQDTPKAQDEARPAKRLTMNRVSPLGETSPMQMGNMQNTMQAAAQMANQLAETYKFAWNMGFEMGTRKAGEEK